MKTNLKFLYPILLGAILACTITKTAFTPAPPQPTIAPAETQIPTSAPTEFAGTPFTFQNVSFVIPEGLAHGANAEVVPSATEDQGGPWGAGPEHISIELSGYPTTNDNEAVKNMILIYPAREYMDANNGAAIGIPRLQAILANPSTPITPENAPGVPVYNAGIVIVARPEILNFNGGSGVRMVTEYAQYPAPITRNGEIYQYSGLTNDGKYFIIAVFPIQSPLQSTPDNPSADGATYPLRNETVDQAEFDAYYQAMTDKLNSSDPNAFQPTLGQLDDLIQSIQVRS